MKSKLFLIATALIFLGFYSCKNAEKTPENPSTKISKDQIKGSTLEYSIQGTDYKAYVAYDSTKQGPLPVVYVFPEWWGVSSYVKGRADQLAQLGYLAVVLDMFGNATVVNTPEEAQKMTKPFYNNPLTAKEILEGAMEKVKNLPQADGEKSAAIGYCFGGAMALNMARIGEPLKAVVSFHGNLVTGVRAQDNKIPMLILNGEADEYVSKDEIASFKKEMDSAKVHYTFINYPGAVHSFTNPESTEVGKKYDMKVAYDENADKASWEEMKKFLHNLLK